MHLLREYIRALVEQEEASSDQGLVEFIVRSNEIEGYNLDLEDVKEAVKEYRGGAGLSYIRTWGPDHKYIVSHLAGVTSALIGHSRSGAFIHQRSMSY